MILPVSYGITERTSRSTPRNPSGLRVHHPVIFPALQCYGFMPLHTWRRQHGPTIVAQVTPLEGLGTWDASAWLVTNPTVVARSPRKFAELISAQATADHLARRTFDHTCDPDSCGPWMFWPQ